MSRFQQIAIRSTFIALICHTFLSCHEMNKTTTNLEIPVTDSRSGLTGNTEGFRQHTAISHDKLSCSSCNLPIKLGFEGSKVYAAIWRYELKPGVRTPITWKGKSV